MSIIALCSKTLKTLSCPPGKAKENVWDARCKGLMLEVRQSGGRTWYVRYVDLRGKQRQLRIGGADVVSLDQARKRTDELRSQVALGRDPAEEKALLRQVPTLAEFVEERYLPYVKGYKRSWKLDESLLRNHLLPKFGTRYLDQIKKDQIVAMHLAHRAKGRAPASANRLLILMRYIYNLALRWETPGVLGNPTKDVPLLEENNKRERYLTQEEAQRLYDVVQHSESKMLRFIIPMLILTGARKREVLDALDGFRHRAKTLAHRAEQIWQGAVCAVVRRSVEPAFADRQRARSVASGPSRLPLGVRQSGYRQAVYLDLLHLGQRSQTRGLAGVEGA